MTRSARRGGFTLLEVLVAFVIMAVALGAIMQIFSTGLAGTRAAEAYAQATQIAESRLAVIGVETPLAQGEKRGDADGGFQWHSVVRAYAPEDEGEDPIGALLVKPYEITLTVVWREGRTERAVALKTIRLGVDPRLSARGRSDAAGIDQ